MLISQIGYAETYFEEEYHQKVKVNSGSVYYTVIEIYYKEKGPQKLKGTMTVLDLDGDGLKICTYNPDQLKNKYGDNE